MWARGDRMDLLSQQVRQRADRLAASILGPSGRMTRIVTGLPHCRHAQDIAICSKGVFTA